MYCEVVVRAKIVGPITLPFDSHVSVRITQATVGNNWQIKFLLDLVSGGKYREIKTRNVTSTNE